MAIKHDLRYHQKEFFIYTGLYRNARQLDERSEMPNKAVVRSFVNV